MSKQLVFATLLSVLSAGNLGAEDLKWVDDYNVVWNSPSTRAVDSMPMGGGNLSLNVWSTGKDLLFYIGSSDSWVDGNAPGKVTQVKLARLRLTLSPTPFAKDFHQELELRSNSIRVQGTADDGTSVELRLWVDAFKPVIHLEGRADKPVRAVAAVETWRGEGAFDGQSVLWNYRNEGPSKARQTAIRTQGLGPIADAIPDPIANLTFGGMLSGPEFTPAGEGQGTHEGQKFRSWALQTAGPTKQFDLRASLRIEQDPSIESWQEGVGRLDAAVSSTAAEDWKRTSQWWASFWNRSRIVINPGAGESDQAWQLGRNYQLFRAMLASNRSGRFPTLFNGGAFLCESNPASRQWSHACFTAQNQRLVYWPLLKSGDSDLLQVGLNYYASRLEVERAWAKHFWNIEGSVFPESPDVFGMPIRMARKDGTSKPACLQYHWTSCMEFALMMLEKNSYTGEDVSHLAPVADGILRFFDQYYRRQHKAKAGQEMDENGRLVIYPGNSLEVYTGTKNATDTLAGLIALSDALLKLPTGMIAPKDRKFYSEFRNRLAPVPTRIMRGHKVISPAGSWNAERTSSSNMELPQLYPVFPFRLYGVGRPELELARNTWLYGYIDAAKQKGHFCWFQGGIFTACLGLTEEAKHYALAKFLHPFVTPPGGSLKGVHTWKLHWLDTPGWKVPRYPAFWDNMVFDQRPDMDHGGSAMIMLQEMLLQSVDDQILLLPAWPADWEVDFKLHAPQQTVVEAKARGGKIVDMTVLPASRAKHVEVIKPAPIPIPLSNAKP